MGGEGEGEGERESTLYIGESTDEKEDGEHATCVPTN